MGDNRTICWRRGIAITFCVNVQAKAVVPVKAKETKGIECEACKLVIGLVEGELTKNSTEVRGARQYSTRTFI